MRLSQTYRILQLRFSAGDAAKQVWKTIPGLLLHQHLWIRKLAADLIGMGFADTGVCKSQSSAAHSKVYSSRYWREQTDAYWGFSPAACSYT